ncbi:MAG: molybdopterin-dependent oxidoreductase [Anaerolineae bacterium]|nr:molybdopterin-dependent oxidoreductase [Anaerolineae bacterium]
MPTLRLMVNGEKKELDIPQSRFLAEVLRYDLGLTGTKIGCNEAECGICTVLVNGTPVNSCVYPAFKAQGAAVETIEGLSANGRLHPLQQAFVDHAAVQCGFCTPGLIMNAKALLDRKAAAGEPVTEHDIKVALKDTYCRCTGYASVIRAIRQAAGEDVAPYIPAVQEPGQAVGRPLPHPDSLAKVTGQAKYADDYAFPGMLYARTKRAGIPHAKILAIDTRAAEALPGVHAVLTHQDVPGVKNHGLVETDWPVLGYDKVRYTGDAVAVVAADTPDIAARAVELIEVDYEPLPVVADPITARQPDAALVHTGRADGNLLRHIKVRKGDLAAGLAEADVIVERTYHTPMTEHAFLEPECAIGIPAGYTPTDFGGELDPLADKGVKAAHAKLTVYVGSQIPYADRSQIAACLGLENEAVRVVGTLVGGGFGGKEDIMGQIHVALLAQKTKCPVKMLYTRQESLQVHPKRHATVIRVKTGATKEGRLTAVEAELYGDTGAYASLGEKVMTRATTHASGPYNVPHVKIDCYAMYTNNPPCGAFRGFGVTQSAFAVESNMDLLAEKLGLDPVEFRRLNALEVGAVTCTGQLLRESVGLKECIDILGSEMKAHHAARGESFRWVWQDGAKHYGWGVALAYKNTGLGGGAPDKSAAEVEVWLDPQQGVLAEVRTSSAEMGQGLPAVLAQITAEELGLSYTQVSVLLSDTDRSPDGGPTTASRQTYLSGNAARYAAQGVRQMLAAATAEHLDCSPDELVFAGGQVRVNGQALDPAAIDLAQAVAWAQEEGRATKVSYEYWAPPTQPLGAGGNMHIAFGFGAQAALCEVDMGTGQVQVQKIIGVHDVGRAINPQTLQGQIEGGMVMCMGYALTEHYVMENGQPWTDVLARYKIPGIKHTPEIVSRIVEHNTTDGPYGAKGVGELPSIPTAPAITNAIYHATGVRVTSLPVDQDALLAALKAGEQEVLTAWGQ